MKPFAPLALALLVLPSVALATGSPRDETEHLNRADMTLAKRASVRKSDLAAGWRLVHSGPPAPNGEQCTSSDPDLSAFVITGRHETTEHGTRGTAQSDIAVSRASGRCRRLQGERTRFLRCLRSAVLQGFEGLLRGRISPRAWRTPRVGRSRSSTGWSQRFPTNGLPRFPMYADVVAIRQGRSGQCSCSWHRWRPLEVRSLVARSAARRRLAATDRRTAGPRGRRRY
jgi:hypothetical protein